MKMNRCISTHIKNILIITFAYVLTHGLIIILTGTWWDEKTWVFASDEQMWKISLHLGKPSGYFVQKFIFSIPELSARILIYLCYYLGTLGVYYIYNQIPFVNVQQALGMTIIYIAIPANDARAMRGVFPYTIGYFLFILAFCVLIVLQKKYDYKNIVLRSCALLLFGGSYTLNSNLVLYAIVLLYIAHYLVSNNQWKKCYKFLDFIALPFVYFGIKTKLFPTFGVYEDYNQVKMESLIKASIKTVWICIIRLIDMLGNWMKHLDIMILPCISIIVVMLIVILLREKKGDSIDEMNGDVSLQISADRSVRPNLVSYRSRLLLIAIGFLLMYLGAFAYVVVELWCDLVGVGGRSSILLPLGAAIVIYGFIWLIPFYKIRKVLIAIISICGVIHFGSYYLSYQQDYYRQRDFVYELKENQNVLRNTKNILYLTHTEPEVGATRFYSLNSNAKEAFGDETHFIMYGPSNYKYLSLDCVEKMHRFIEEEFLMCDYQIGRSTSIEAIVIYDNEIRKWDALVFRLKGLIHDDSYKNKLYRDTNLLVYTPDNEEFNKILEQYGIENR